MDAFEKVQLPVYSDNYTAPNIPPVHHGFYMRLKACQGFLLLYLSDRANMRPSELLWLVDLSTAKWHELPMLPEVNNLFREQEQMCERRCDVVP